MNKFFAYAPNSGGETGSNFLEPQLYRTTSLPTFERGAFGIEIYIYIYLYPICVFAILNGDINCKRS